MKVLCLGGSRFLGPVLVNCLLKLGHEVTVVNRGTRLVSYAGAVKYIQADRNQGSSHFGSYDVVIDNCAYKPSDIEHLLKRVEFNFLIFISTIAVYKKTEQFPLTEDSPLGAWPVFGEYNQKKVACEAFLAQSNLKYSSVRPVYMLGPKNHIPKELFLYGKLIKKEPIVLPGNGEAVVQFVFVDEVAELVTKLAEKKNKGAYNCAGSDKVTLKGLVEKMSCIAGVKPHFDFNPKADGISHRPEEFPFANENILCSHEKAKSMGVDFCSIDAGLKRDFENHYKSFFV